MRHSILIVEDDEILATNIQTYLGRKDYDAQVCHSAEQALKLFETQPPDVILTDNSLPGMSGIDLFKRLRIIDAQVKLIMMTGHGNIQDAVTAMQVGAFNYLTKPVVLAELKILLDKALTTQHMENTLAFYQQREARDAGLAAMIGESPAMLELKSMVRQLLDAESRMTDSCLPTVLIQGETGTGKELVARALHYDGIRCKGPFVEINCASIPPHLVEAELFGHEKGAFTDAKERRVGLVEAAEGGTLFLDEVGELDLAMQAKLLKLLEDRTVRRIGSVKERKVDLRIISATNCDLEHMVQQGRFRRDLFFRLRILSIKVPSLAARSNDILMLATHFLALHARRYGKPSLRFSAEAQRLLLSYSWPGNVRELRNMLEQTVLLASSETITPSQLTICPSLMRANPGPRTLYSSEPFDTPVISNDPEPSELERTRVIRMLNRTDWNVTKSARLLGLTRDMLRYRIERLGLVRPERNPL